MQDFVENDARFQSAQTHFDFQIARLDIVKRGIDCKLEEGRLTATDIERLIDVKLDVRDAAMERIRVVNLIFREDANRHVPERKSKAPWARFLNK